MSTFFDITVASIIILGLIKCANVVCSDPRNNAHLGLFRRLRSSVNRIRHWDASLVYAAIVGAHGLLATGLMASGLWMASLTMLAAIPFNVFYFSKLRSLKAYAY